jgi:hypothetical protein
MKTLENTTKPPLTYEQLLAGRLLIAKFIGVHETTGHYDSYGTQVPCYWTDNDLYRTPTFSKPELSYKNFIEASKYDESWDWIMPVYKKIHEILAKVERPSNNHCCKGDSIEVDIHCAVTTIDINKTFIYVVEFIEWWNGCGLSLAAR